VQGEGRPANPDSIATLEALIERTRQEDPGSAVLLMTTAGVQELLEQREEAMRIYRSLLEGDRLPPMQAALISNISYMYSSLMRDEQPVERGSWHGSRFESGSRSEDRMYCCTSLQFTTVAE
jgi:hypothetical protein